MGCFGQLFSCPTHNLVPEQFDASSAPLQSLLGAAFIAIFLFECSGNGGVQLVSVGVRLAAAHSIVYYWHQLYPDT